MTSKISALLLSACVLMPVSAAALPAEGAGISVPDPSISDSAIQTTLEEIAALDPNLSVTFDDAGEVDGMVMLSDVLFDFASSTLAPEAIGTLETVASKLGGVQGIEISGHTDSIGPDDENYILGKARANTVRAWLIAHGDFEAYQITAVSKGETDPVIENLTGDGVDNPEGRAQNRRVEFHIIEEVQEGETPAS